MSEKIRNVPSVETCGKVGIEWRYIVTCRYCGKVCGAHGVTKQRAAEISDKFVRCSKTKTFRGEVKQ
jgi:hypothetical protein